MFLKFVIALPGRGTGEVPPGDAIRWFISATNEAGLDLDEVVVLDEPDAQRTMVPLVDAERRRARAARDMGVG